jgi:hypothetical protein
MFRVFNWRSCCEFCLNLHCSYVRSILSEDVNWLSFFKWKGFIFQKLYELKCRWRLADLAFLLFVANSIGRKCDKTSTNLCFFIEYLYCWWVWQQQCDTWIWRKWSMKNRNEHMWAICILWNGVNLYTSLVQICLSYLAFFSKGVNNVITF